jgi:hypothetical protein
MASKVQRRLEAVVRINRRAARSMRESDLILLRQAAALAIFTIVLFVPMCVAHADEGNSQGLTDADPGFVQDACPPGIVTYYYDEHTGRNRIDCHPDPEVLEMLTYLGDLDYCHGESPDAIEADGNTSYCASLPEHKPSQS